LARAKRKVGLFTTLAVVGMCFAATPAFAARGEQSFVSNPKLHPPRLTVNVSRRGQAPGFIFLGTFSNLFLTQPGIPNRKKLVGQPGPLIVDNHGQVVWFRPVPSNLDALNLEVQTYQRKPVLTWWVGTITLPQGENTQGTYYVANDHYRIIKTITVKSGGWILSEHEFTILPNGTALVTAYRHVPADLRAIGGAQNGTLLDSAVLQYNLKTGKLVFQWDAAQHIPLTDTYGATGTGRTSPRNPNAFDAYHINSIDQDSHGNLLVSARNTQAIYKVDRKTGNVLWTLGGKRSTFTFGPNAAFAWQHDARFLKNNQISMFDNHCCAINPGPPASTVPAPRSSRGLVLKLDLAHKRATFVRGWSLYNLQVATQGDLQLLPGGHTFLGFGQQPFWAEFSKSHKLLLSVRLPDPDISYRVFRFRWVGHAPGRPQVVARRHGKASRVYVSWNGATEVASYQVLAGSSSHSLSLAKRAARRGFETVITVSGGGPLFEVRALDARGHVLGTSKVVRRR
jgi:hypothetical protein